ncbi:MULTISPECIES: bifunctional 4-hydroxy-2-oxoglutarate aldolase/2-dehydro-3-deoxy-phosphogluconate aldolase [Enterococcus]|uniref:Keto-hydroxyglutarate-aldolase/keto-deoxy-phosphogluconate aldolase n=1 Tax=Enterococcus sulfureus ATCC 49903 TaxID=1140003 RepID=S0PB72_9ENTE|nr:bifunctional 4-hydroxy-2-oxoglutarate aldolase/2-dehydro-3-deoxy-phosphogluconate aldolase [Enterococcus sulfureus]EOT48618.1 keto-hydroxyglutarate-aldolase/keto-deoxy- phosphogluconate aldolase [Enterococcus sulfureus ATCC 49903]EOT87510.1 keto-hydroxyglutarate-aldolase/keto-deoxy- phosphogluconate aldolase [Enterococcus sulfureus ATCC 49903]
MQRVEILKKIKQAGIIAVVRGDSKEEAIAFSEALIAGGILGIEITYTLDQASEIIETLRHTYRDRPEVLIGAGTVLDATTARLAILAGATYIVSPSFDSETARLCNLYQIPYLPGCMTITEMNEALSSGVDIIKLFPGNLYAPKMIHTFKQPLPQLNIMPTGGVDLDNMSEWFKQGAVAVGVGSHFMKVFQTKGVTEVTALAKEYSTLYQQIVRE